MWRIIALVFHWIALVALMASVDATYDNEDIVILSFMVIVVTSILLTRTLMSGVKVTVTEANRREKAKREMQIENLDARTQLLVALLDEDERARVRQRLMTEVADGETIAIDDLLYDRQNHRSSN